MYMYGLYVYMIVIACSVCISLSIDNTRTVDEKPEDGNSLWVQQHQEHHPLQEHPAERKDLLVFIIITHAHI